MKQLSNQQYNFTDPDVRSGSTYTYRLLARFIDGSFSPISTAVKVKLYYPTSSQATSKLMFRNRSPYFHSSANGIVVVAACSSSRLTPLRLLDYVKAAKRKM
ncbi:MAG: hypothetical protein AAFU67_04620 [Bacteroidota bacterium]